MSLTDHNVQPSMVSRPNAMVLILHIPIVCHWLTWPPFDLVDSAATPSYCRTIFSNTSFGTLCCLVIIITTKVYEENNCSEVKQHTWSIWMAPGKKIDPILIRYCYGARIQLICQCIQVQFFDMSVRRQSKQRGMIRCLYVAKVNENPWYKVSNRKNLRCTPRHRHVTPNMFFAD